MKVPWWALLVIGCHAAPPTASPHVDPAPPAAPAATPHGIADLDAYCDDKLNSLREVATQEAADAAARVDVGGESGGPVHEEPTCEARDVRKLAAPYLAAAILRVSNEDLVRGTCQLAIHTDAGWFLVGAALECGTFEPRERTRNLTLVGAKQDGATLELALHYSAEPIDAVPSGPPSTSLNDIGDAGAEVDFSDECTYDHAVACKQR
jgi:hypothetical protein